MMPNSRRAGSYESVQSAGVGVAPPPPPLHTERRLPPRPASPLARPSRQSQSFRSFAYGFATSAATPGDSADQAASVVGQLRSVGRPPGSGALGAAPSFGRGTGASFYDPAERSASPGILGGAAAASASSAASPDLSGPSNRGFLVGAAGMRSFNASTSANGPRGLPQRTYSFDHPRTLRENGAALHDRQHGPLFQRMGSVDRGSGAAAAMGAPGRLIMRGDAASPGGGITMPLAPPRAAARRPHHQHAHGGGPKTRAAPVDAAASAPPSEKGNGWAEPPSPPPDEAAAAGAARSSLLRPRRARGSLDADADVPATVQAHAPDGAGGPAGSGAPSAAAAVRMSSSNELGTRTHSLLRPRASLLDGGSAFVARGRSFGRGDSPFTDAVAGPTPRPMAGDGSVMPPSARRGKMPRPSSLANGISASPAHSNQDLRAMGEALAAAGAHQVPRYKPPLQSRREATTEGSEQKEQGPAGGSGLYSAPHSQRRPRTVQRLPSSGVEGGDRLLFVHPAGPSSSTRRTSLPVAVGGAADGSPHRGPSSRRASSARSLLGATAGGSSPSDTSGAHVRPSSQGEDGSRRGGAPSAAPSARRLPFADVSMIAHAHLGGRQLAELLDDPAIEGAYHLQMREAQRRRRLRVVRSPEASERAGP